MGLFAHDTFITSKEKENVETFILFGGKCSFEHDRWTPVWSKLRVRKPHLNDTAFFVLAE
jgi:hypothetical protein